MQNVKVDRDKYIGGSDIPILMGISPFKTRWELLQEKAGLLENDFKGNEYTEFGNMMEPKIRDFINIGLKDKFVEGKDIIDDIRCHTDGINKTTVLEIKTTSQIRERVEDYLVYLVQLLFYMKYTKRKKGILAVYERPDNFDETFYKSRLTLFAIDIKDYKNLLEEIDLAVDDFRNDLKRIKENPFLTEQELEPKELIELASELEKIKSKLVEYEPLLEKEKEIKTQLKSKMDEIGKRQFKSDLFKFTRVVDGKDTVVDTFDLERFKTDYEELSKEYITQTVKKGKAGFVKMTAIKEI